MVTVECKSGPSNGGNVSQESREAAMEKAMKTDPHPAQQQLH